MASGILFLHSLSPPVLHRDIKSLNILLHTDIAGELHAKSQTLNSCQVVPEVELDEASIEMLQLGLRNVGKSDCIACQKVIGEADFVKSANNSLSSMQPPSNQQVRSCKTKINLPTYSNALNQESNSRPVALNSPSFQYVYAQQGGGQQPNVMLVYPGQVYAVNTVPLPTEDDLKWYQKREARQAGKYGMILIAVVAFIIFVVIYNWMRS
ncbi:hypothetical protein BC829DRAFT_392985 [Chytridium lagenaria]|nr:hypothetical protein BC829DRAFT_392985 [Chytridium lagenaria]